MQTVTYSTNKSKSNRPRKVTSFQFPQQNTIIYVNSKLFTIQFVKISTNELLCSHLCKLNQIIYSFTRNFYEQQPIQFEYNPDRPDYARCSLFLVMHPSHCIILLPSNHFNVIS